MPTAGERIDVTPAGGLVTIGETMGLLTSMDYGPLRHARRLALSIAGAESNVAIGVRRLGHPATWVSRVGEDEVGDLIESTLRGEGVQLDLGRDPSRPTGLMLKSRRTASVTRVSYYRAASAASALCSDDIPFERIASAAVLHVTGITPALSLSCRRAVTDSMEHARAHGTRVSFDVNYRAALWDREVARPVLRELAALADVLFAGEEEAELLLGATGRGTPAELAAALSRLGPGEVVVKRGAAGALSYLDGCVLDMPPLPVRTVDPVGAGDAFVAGYLAGLLDGASSEERLRLANRTGAFAVTVSGDWEGAPSRREVELLGYGDGAVVR